MGIAFSKICTFIVNKKTLPHPVMTKAEIRFVQELRLKKHRDQRRLFVAEGGKLVDCLKRHLTPCRIYSAPPACAPDALPVSEGEMRKISLLSTPSDVLGVFEQPPPLADIDLAGKWALALDGVQDPANVGGIVRLCDWFGVDALLCSPHTADCYAPKAVQATMGAIARIRIAYANLADILPAANACIYGTFLEGGSIYDEPFGQGGVVVLGSEGQGISPQVASIVHKKLHIPSFAPRRASESLNVASAAAIVCSEIRRRGC